MPRNVIRELVVKILGEDTDLQRAGGRSEATLKRIGRAGLEVGRALAAAGAAGVAGLSLLVKRQIDVADQARKMSASIGVDVETLTAMRHAADLSGVSHENLEKALGRMARASSDAAAGLATQRAAFDALGVAVANADGTLRGQREILGDVADRFAAMEDGTRKTALAQEVFGRAGTQLIPLLNQGRDGLQAMTDEAARLGLVIDEDTARAAEAFNDNLTRLKGVFTGGVNLIAQRVLPILVDLSDRFVDASGKTGTFEDAIDKAEAALRSILTAGAIAKGVFTAVGEAIGGVAAAVSFAVRGQFREAWESLKTVGTDTAETVQQTVNQVRVVWEELGKDVAASAPRVGQQLAAPAVAARTAIQTETDRMREAVAKLVEGLEEERATLGLSADELLRYRLAKLGASEETIANAIALQRETTALRTAEAQRRTWAEQGQEAARLFGEAVREGHAAINGLSRASAAFGQQFATAIEQAATQGSLSFKSFADSVIGQLKRILVQALVTRVVAFLFPGLAPAAGVAPAPLPRQHGGPVQRGRAYVVGEAGPELFVPQAAGQVVPGGLTLRLDVSSLPAPPRVVTPEAVATDDWWRRAFSALRVDHLDRGGR